MNDRIGLSGLQSDGAQRLGGAFAVSIVAHAMLLSWPVSLPAAGLIGATSAVLQRSAPRGLTVTLQALREEERPLPQSEPPLDPPTKQPPLAVAAGDKPKDEAKDEPKDESRGAAQNSVPLLGYYPASKLTRMPEAVSIFRVEPPPGGDSGLAGKVTLRLWIGANGEIDRVRVVDNGLPQAYADAALAAFERMRFEPGEIGGVPVRTWVEVVIEYADFRDAAQAGETPADGANAGPAK